MADHLKIGFPYLDGRLEAHGDSLVPPQTSYFGFRIWGALDESDGEIRLHIRRLEGTNSETVISIAADGAVRSIDRYES